MCVLSERQRHQQTKNSEDFFLCSSQAYHLFSLHNFSQRLWRFLPRIFTTAEPQHTCISLIWCHSHKYSVDCQIRFILTLAQASLTRRQSFRSRGINRLLMPSTFERSTTPLNILIYRERVCMQLTRAEYFYLL